MSDAAMQKALTGCDRTDCTSHQHKCAATLAALTAAGYAVVRLPEGVEVTHGARLMPAPELYWSEVYVIESTPAGACYCGPNGGPHWHEAAP